MLSSSGLLPFACGKCLTLFLIVLPGFFSYIRRKKGRVDWRAASSKCSLPNSAAASLFADMVDRQPHSVCRYHDPSGICQGA